MAAHMPRPVRVPADVWQAALAAARANGTTLSAVVVEHLRRYAADNPAGDPIDEQPPGDSGT